MSKHMKRLSSPRVWSVPKKGKKWVTRVNPGPHPIERSAPLLIFVRDMLHYCDTNREGKRIIGSRNVLVDGKPVTDEKRAVGLMDVVSLPLKKENYRVMLDSKGKLRPVKIDDAKAKWKLARIENKKVLKGGRVQINLHDGRNILMEVDNYKTGDVLKIELPTQKVLDNYTMDEGMMALVIDGKHSGQISAIDRVEEVRGPAENIVWFKDGFSTTKGNVFVVGKKTPEIKLPEVKAI